MLFLPLRKASQHMPLGELLLHAKHMSHGGKVARGMPAHFVPLHPDLGAHTGTYGPASITGAITSRPYHHVGTIAGQDAFVYDNPQHTLHHQVFVRLPGSSGRIEHYDEASHGPVLARLAATRSALAPAAQQPSPPSPPPPPPAPAPAPALQDPDAPGVQVGDKVRVDPRWFWYKSPSGARVNGTPVEWDPHTDEGLVTKVVPASGTRYVIAGKDRATGHTMKVLYAQQGNPDWRNVHGKLVHQANARAFHEDYESPHLPHLNTQRPVVLPQHKPGSPCQQIQHPGARGGHFYFDQQGCVHYGDPPSMMQTSFPGKLHETPDGRMWETIGHDGQDIFVREHDPADPSSMSPREIKRGILKPGHPRNLDRVEDVAF